MRRQQVGPGTNRNNAIIPGSAKDIQKAAPAGGNADGYRSKSVALGPQSSHVQWEATKDAGVNLPCSGEGGKDFYGEQNYGTDSA